MNKNNEAKHTTEEAIKAAAPRMYKLLKSINALPITYADNAESDWDCGHFVNYALSDAIADLMTAIAHPDEGLAKKLLWNDNETKNKENE